MKIARSRTREGKESSEARTTEAAKTVTIGDILRRKVVHWSHLVHARLAKLPVEKYTQVQRKRDDSYERERDKSIPV